uniref:HD domain-containing protein n=1 Tax=Caldilinea aerophila TaxID=133453 RepID=A0A7C1FEK1_9CHLR
MDREPCASVGVKPVAWFWESPAFCALWQPVVSSLTVELLSIHWQPAQAAFVALLNALAEVADPVYIVGGVVRDLLLQRADKLNDLDVVISRDANVAARRAADRLGWAYYPLDADRDVARLVFTAGPTPLVCDVAGMRGGDLETDLQARDFTVNAMALRWRRNCATELIDPVGGRSDLEARVLRRVTPWSLAEDPVRLLRGVRLAIQLGFAIEEATLVQMLRLSDALRLVSAERVRDELWKMLALSEPDKALEMLREFRFLHTVLPEVAQMEDVAQSAPHDADVYHHTLRAVRYAAALHGWIVGERGIDHTPAGAELAAALTPYLGRLRQVLLEIVAAERRLVDWLVWFALWHDAGKPATRSIEQAPDGSPRYRFLGHEEVGARLARQRMEALKFSRHEVALLQAVTRMHMRPHHLHTAFRNGSLSRRACYRFFRDASQSVYGNAAHAEVGIATVLLALADYQAIFAESPPPEWSAYVRHAAELIQFGLGPGGLECVRKPLVDGRLLMHYFKLEPGRQVGELLEQLREAQAAGEITTPEEGLALAAELLAGSR